LFRLCYVSHNRIAPSQQLAELQAILTRAAVANGVTGITGVLIVSRGYFCQVIEGVCSDVEQLFESIQLDDRHEDITVLEFVPIAKRQFAGWEMAYFDMDHHAADTGHIGQLVRQLSVVETGHNIVNVFGHLIQRRERYAA
jgi:hypothetical protein